MSRLDLTQPDDLGAFIGKTLASFVSGNNQPDMSGDDRNRIRFPHIRDRYDRSCVALAAEILAAVSPASQPGMNDGVAGENAPSLPEASPVGGGVRETLELARKQFDLLVRLSSGNAVYEVDPATQKRTRRKLSEVIATEAAAGSKHCLQALAVMSPRDEE